MNPFDWLGPRFLAFYALLAIVTIVIAWLQRRRVELRMSANRVVRLTDPYAIAFLRGGKNEMVCVVAVALIDRGLMLVERDDVWTSDLGKETRPERMVERELLEACRVRRGAKELFSSHVCAGAAHDYELELERLRLLPDEEVRAARMRIFIAAAVLLLGTAAIKIAVALSRGRTNVGFLIALAAISVIALRAVVLARRTAGGSAYLEELKNLFNSLLGRQIHPGGGSNELAMLAAVWGVTVLPARTFPWTEQLFKRAQQSSSCGSSCGSSCSSGCGGCGGGGCGGCGG